MARTVSLLDQVRIASPCSMSWSAMHGDDKVRFCDQCRLHVYNLSAMTRAEAERTIREKEGRLCCGFYRRQDGTIMTRDCPVGLAAARRALRRCVRVSAAVIALIFATGLLAFGKVLPSRRLRTMEPFALASKWLVPVKPIPATNYMTMGEIGAVPPPALLGRVKSVRVPQNNASGSSNE